jgi:hypothetical protein
MMAILADIFASLPMRCVLTTSDRIARYLRQQRDAGLSIKRGDLLMWVLEKLNEEDEADPATWLNLPPDVWQWLMDIGFLIDCGDEPIVDGEGRYACDISLVMEELGIPFSIVPVEDLISNEDLPDGDMP